MRAYSDEEEEALRTRGLLKDWLGEGLLTEEQYSRMEQETPCELRRTNVFLRIVMFLFTMFIVGSGAGLFFSLFVRGTSGFTAGLFLLVFAGVSYASAEVAVYDKRFYRYGTEEALALASVGFLCTAIAAVMSDGHMSAPGAVLAVPVAGALLSLWIWHRFGFRYAFAAAMIFAACVPFYWTPPFWAQHAIVAGCYAAALAGVAALRPRYRGTYLDAEWSVAEGLLWLGIYLAVNLQLSPINLYAARQARGWVTPEVRDAFYWITWVAIWCLPALMLARGLRGKDRFVMAAGGVTAILTLVTNKRYLGWQRHSWDPMLLGALLLGVALYVRRWLAAGADGIRGGFTAERLSGKDRGRLNFAAAAMGVVAPHSIGMQPQAGRSGNQFGGGDSGGGGASSDY